MTGVVNFMEIMMYVTGSSITFIINKNIINNKCVKEK